MKGWSWLLQIQNQCEVILVQMMVAKSKEQPE
jgi:hypothetical protein